MLRWGHWYVVGHDVDRDAPRAFRVDRIDGDPEIGARDGSFEPPPGIDPAEFVRDDPLTYGEDQPVDARVLVDASRVGLGGRRSSGRTRWSSAATTARWWSRCRW